MPPDSKSALCRPADSWEWYARMRSWATSSASCSAAGIRAERGLDLLLGHPQLVDLDPVETRGQTAERVVSSGPHVVDDGSPLLDEDRSCSSTGRGSASRELAPAAGKAAKVEATESHSPSMLSETRRLAPARSTAPAEGRRPTVP